MSVTLTINGKCTQVPPGLSIFDCAEEIGVQVPTSCRKNGKCKECIVEVITGAELLTPRTFPESHLKDPFRLSCQCFFNANEGDVKCHTMRRGQMRIERHALDLPSSHKKMPLEPCVTRDGDRILLDGREIARSTGPIHGLAMDLGTTTCVLRLINLETGELVADASFENPQRFGGSDVMSRIQYDTDHKGKLLMRTLAGYLTHAIEAFPVDPKTIYEMVVVGNSTMRDLFFHLNVYSIGQTPYRSITELEMEAGKRTDTVVTLKGKQSLLPIHPEARVYGGPIISGHLGADAAACMLAIDLANESRIVAVMDIGTNTELVVGNKDRILAASCPAGPAFEGGAISCGMPGLEGAIEDVRINDDGTFKLGVIGDVEPQGICGSGLVDLMSELLRMGKMNEYGRFEESGSRIVLNEKNNVYFVESDVNELAQAKGANVAGLQTVFNTMGIGFDDLDLFYLAGGFGRHLKVDASKRIGLIPNLSDSKIVQVGNAAIEGACIALLSKTKRAELEALVKRVEHVRLETHPNFFDFFVEGCQFKPVEDSQQAVGMIELVDTLPDINVQPAEYKRLLGYPRDRVVDGRARELAEWARTWYAKNGRPWVYAREAQSLELINGSILVDGVSFASPKLQKTLHDAGAHGVILAAVSAGPELEAESQRLWLEEKPDEYFFLEIFGSAVVEHLMTMTGARLCAWADSRKMAVLPHYSPGYPEWEIDQQPNLLELLSRTAQQPLPGKVEVLESGMLKPKKSLIAVFGLTNHVDRVRKLTDLVPCENCSFASCQYRRVPYRRAPEFAKTESPSLREQPAIETAPEPVKLATLTRDAKYAVNARALDRWAAERLTLTTNDDGTFDAVFKYEGSTCSNMGRAIRFVYHVKVGPREDGYPLKEMTCGPAPGDEGHRYMCRYMTNAEHLMVAIDHEKPLLGQSLNDVLAWQRPTMSPSCYCEPSSRKHKWGLVLETIHYALVQLEKKQEQETLVAK